MNIQKLFNLFKENNKELYQVGGSVRDFLMKTPTKDLDFATNSLPEEIERILELSNLKH